MLAAAVNSLNGRQWKFNVICPLIKKKQPLPTIPFAVLALCPRCTHRPYKTLFHCRAKPAKHSSFSAENLLPANNMYSPIEPHDDRDLANVPMQEPLLAERLSPKLPSRHSLYTQQQTPPMCTKSTQIHSQSSSLCTLHTDMKSIRKNGVTKKKEEEEKRITRSSIDLAGPGDAEQNFPSGVWKEGIKRPSIRHFKVIAHVATDVLTLYFTIR